PARRDGAGTSGRPLPGTGAGSRGRTGRARRPRGGAAGCRPGRGRRGRQPAGEREHRGNTALVASPPTGTAVGEPGGGGDMSIQQTGSIQETQQVLEAYATTHDTSLVAPDAVFHDVASGQDFIGREAIAGMLHYVYHVAFEA